MFLIGFQRFIAPSVIKFFYYLGFALTIFGGLGVIVYAIAEIGSLGAAGSASMIAAAVVGVPFTILLMRFSTEMWLVLFEMNDRLGDIRDRTVT